MLSRNRIIYASPLLLQKRNIASQLGKLAARLLRFRYLALGAGVGGSYTISKKYDELKDFFPDISIKDYIPVDDVRETLKHLREYANDLAGSMMTSSEKKKDSLTASMKYEATKDVGDVPLPVSEQIDSAKKPAKSQVKHVTVEELQEAIFKNELAFHKRIEALLQENRELRKELLLKSQKSAQKGRINKSLIDMYSEVLDELSDLDSAYNAQ
ncbi:unnamed protein product, partial [Trichobilharzia szidati]